MTKEAPAAGSPAAPAPEQPDNLKAATTFEASGAVIEPTIVDRVDMKHPAVDDEPRKGLPETSNRVDFNDPTISGAEAVRRNLEAQGSDAGGKPSKD